MPPGISTSNDTPWADGTIPSTPHQHGPPSQTPHLSPLSVASPRSPLLPTSPHAERGRIPDTLTPAPPDTAGGGAGFAPPPYSEQPTYTSHRGLTWGHAVTGTTSAPVNHPSALPERKVRSFLEPLALPSPFAKAPKSRVSNFREGLREGGLGAWAEVREGLKGPVGLTWYWAKEGGAIGALNGLGYGTAILALCPISASIAFINHSSRGAIRGVRSAKERRQAKRITAKSTSTLSTANPAASPLSMQRTSTMGSAISRRSRVGNLLSRVTTSRSASGPRTPDDENTAEVEVSDTGEGSSRRITPFPQSPLGGYESSAASPGSIPPGKRAGTTQLELDTKWGSPTSPSLAAASGSGRRSTTVESTPRLDGMHQIELDTKWGLSALPPLVPPAMPYAWQSDAEAGPSNRGTPQLERDIKWPIVPPADDGVLSRNGEGKSRHVMSAIGSGAPGRPPVVEETSGLEMQLKWENEMARAGRG